jgi:hypothetical protein
MAKKAGVNADNLAALGAARLAELLMELAEADASVRKRLVLAAAEGSGATGLAKAIDKRLTALSKARGHIGWDKARAFAAEIEGLRRAIAPALVSLDPRLAAERLETFVRLAPSVLERVIEADDKLGQSFRGGVADLAALWSKTLAGNPEGLAGRVLSLIVWDEYGICDELLGLSAEALGPAGLSALARMATEELTPASGASSREDRMRQHRLRKILVEIADLRGDVDAFIALQLALGAEKVDVPAVARRLLAANRAEEALAWLDRPSGRPELRVMTRAALAVAEQSGQGFAGLAWERENLRIQALEMLRRRPEAQAIRWRLFEHTLAPDLLRAYLKLLPDFEDDEALERAFALADAHPSASMALAFFIEWPNLKRAAALVERRGGEINPRDYELLEAAAESLADTQAHGSILLYRSMIESILQRAYSPAYGHAARYLKACADLADAIDWAARGVKPHDAYMADLRSRHGRKAGFWRYFP